MLQKKIVHSDQYKFDTNQCNHPMVKLILSLLKLKELFCLQRGEIESRIGIKILQIEEIE
jgi:hypothetical protein